MSPLDKFVYNAYVRIGDRVILNVDKETRTYHHSTQPNGQTGTVIGFNRTTVYKGRHEVFMYGKSGRFEYNGSPVISWDNGVTERIPASDLSPVEAVLQQRCDDHAYNQAFEKIIYIESLPSTLFYEGDIVRLNNVCEFDRAMITSIDYGKLFGPESKHDDKLTPAYSLMCCQFDDKENVKLIDKWRDRQFRLMDISRILERGNYWHWEHDKTRLKFFSPEHEAQFYQSLGIECPSQAHVT